MFIDIQTYTHSVTPSIKCRFSTAEQLLDVMHVHKIDMAAVLATMPFELDTLLLSWRLQGKISEITFRKIAYENAEKLYVLK